MGAFIVGCGILVAYVCTCLSHGSLKYFKKENPVFPDPCGHDR